MNLMTPIRFKYIPCGLKWWKHVSVSILYQCFYSRFSVCRCVSLFKLMMKVTFCIVSHVSLFKLMMKVTFYVGYWGELFGSRLSYSLEPRNWVCSIF